MDLQGKGVLITGASQGLGAALAESVARAGARIALVARGSEALEKTAARIRAAGGEAHALPADVADKRAVHGIAGAAAAPVGPIEVLVHNASTLGPVPLRLLLDTECEDLTAVLETNLVGPFRLTKIIAGAMALRGSGVVVHVSSDAAVEAYPRWGAYGVSKAAQDQLSRVRAAGRAPAGGRPARRQRRGDATGLATGAERARRRVRAAAIRTGRRKSPARGRVRCRRPPHAHRGSATSAAARGRRRGDDRRA